VTAGDMRTVIAENQGVTWSAQSMWPLPTSCCCFPIFVGHSLLAACVDVHRVSAGSVQTQLSTCSGCCWASALGQWLVHAMGACRVYVAWGVTLPKLQQLWCVSESPAG
jgi:hypothetical protein